MPKSHLIIFKPQRIADDDWQVRAFCPGARIEYIPGFKTEDAATEWIADKSAAWAEAWDSRNG
jgi:hypothetical protein